MAKPRIFLSSTCYDLNDARAALTTFLEGYNFEVLNSQLPGFGVTPGRGTADACLDQVEIADYLVLIVGTRSGSVQKGTNQTITNAEYNRATEKGIPIIPFVKKEILHALRIYEKNPAGDFSNEVDNPRVFDFINVIRSGKKDPNWLHEFDNVNDIIATLRAQFAEYLRLFSVYLGRMPDGRFGPQKTAVALNGYPAEMEVLGTTPRLLRIPNPEEGA